MTLKKIGFVILSHRDPDQLLRLCRRLATLYDDPPIACHHDFSQSSLDPRLFPPCVSFVTPSMATTWGKWVGIKITLAATELLYRVDDPDYFVLLSGSDYPLASARTVERDLVASGADAFLDGYSTVDAMRGAESPHEHYLANFRSPMNIQIGRRRYVRAQIKVPVPRRTAAGGWRLGGRTYPLPFDSPFAPFGPHFRSYYGSQWFTANRAVARRLLNPTPIELRLQRHLKARIIPEESYVQTVVMNDPSLTVDHRARHYADWKRGGPHPAFLTIDDLDEARDTGAHFARKFLPDDPALDEIDRFLNAGG